MSKLSEKIKEIRTINGMSQESFAKELGYSSKTSIAKIEKGINEISFDKLMLLIKKYQLDIDDLMDNNCSSSFDALNENSNLFVSFSARSDGNCADCAKYLMKNTDKLIHFKDIFYNSCSKCNYECLKGECKYKNDDVYDLLRKTEGYHKIIFIVPMYASNPSSLFFSLSERMYQYFNQYPSKYDYFINRLHFISIYGNEIENPNFNDNFERIIGKDNNHRILKIERYKYDAINNNKIIDNPDIKIILNTFKIALF